MTDQVKKLVAELKMENYVIFAGLQKDVRPFYWSGNLFTLCSTNVETFSIAALESMACGLPCVLTDIGGAREMIVEGLTGYLSKTDDASIADAWLKALKTDFRKEKIFAFIQNHFDSSKMVEEYRKIL
jgi:glycosyltransferase involved in cell wall biosynthesis